MLTGIFYRGVGSLYGEIVRANALEIRPGINFQLQLWKEVA